MTAGWAAGILEFWINELGPSRWWMRSEETDRTIRERFGALWEEQRAQPPNAFLASAEQALAAVILFDQFPRNMFRHEARAFSTDALARDIARAAIERGFDDMIESGLRSWLYMPFMHSESLVDQDRSVALFTALGNAEPLKFAIAHRALIERFGRFPYRNAALGRANAAGEDDAVNEGKDW